MVKLRNKYKSDTQHSIQSISNPKPKPKPKPKPNPKPKPKHILRISNDTQQLLMKYVKKTKVYKTDKTDKAKYITKQPKANLKLLNNSYISTLINLFYDNDKVVKQYIKDAPYRQHIFPSPPNNNIIIFGDIHGDFEVAIRCLILAKCIDPIKIPSTKSVSLMDAFFNQLKWIGGDTYIVQLGDQIDRVRPQTWDNNDITNDNAFEDEGSTLEIFYLFYHLNNLAILQGGRVFSIIGNHEIMNVDGDFRYVSKKEFHCFKDHLKSVYTPNSRYPYHSQTLKKNINNIHMAQSNNSNLPYGYRERLYAFAPSGLCANMMATTYYTMLQIGEWLFCHGSPTLYIAKTFPIDMVNNIVSLYLLNNSPIDKTLETYYNAIMVSHPNVSEKDETSILWARTFGESSRSNDKQLQPLLNTILLEYNKKNNYLVAQQPILQLPSKTQLGTQLSTHLGTYTNATHIAIGHTPQFTKGINSICNNTVWRCDIGMSKAFLTHNNTRTKSFNHIYNSNNNSNNSNTANPPSLSSLSSLSTLSSSVSDIKFKHGDIQILHIKNGIPIIINE